MELYLVVICITIYKGCIKNCTLFRCTFCGCNVAGTLPGGGCDLSNGTCYCKEFVTGQQCDQCVSGYVNLEESNPLGCSAGLSSLSLFLNNYFNNSRIIFFIHVDVDHSFPNYPWPHPYVSHPYRLLCGCSFIYSVLSHVVPDELAPPILTVLSSSSILLQWRPPEVPANGFIQGYRIFVDNTQVATVTGLNYTREGLSASTRYLFFIEAFNSAGSTRSDVAMETTLEGVPTGVDPPILNPVNSTAVSASWTTPTSPNGAIIRYELVQVLLGPELVIIEEFIVFSGLSFSATVSGLQPFTTYTFIIRACTSGGCGPSIPATIQTLEAPPAFQATPNVTVISSNSLLVEWVEPAQPNGVVTQYEVRQRVMPFNGNGISVTNTSGGVASTLVNGLQPFTGYEFSVTAYTNGGATASEWRRERTGEASKSR